jgi:hypothetical protein
MSLSTNVTDLATRVATECKSLRTLINGNAVDLSGLDTTATSSLVAAINELVAGVAAAAVIDDAATDTDTAWSSQKIVDEITAAIQTAIAALINGAPAALDTLEEIANALGDNANLAATLTADIANRVRYDAAQSLTAPQQAQARTNIAAAAAVDVTALTTAVGATDADYVATFVSALV